jgi:FkbM family methyltransferase
MRMENQSMEKSGLSTLVAAMFHRTRLKGMAEKNGTLANLIGLWKYRNATRYILRIGDVESTFSLQDWYSTAWFLPRYADGRIHEPGATVLLVALLRRAEAFVDVGAHLGFYSGIAAKMLKDPRQLVAFEMDSRTHALAEKNLVANGVASAQCLQRAVSDSNGELTYSRPKDWSGPALSMFETHGEEEVTVKTVGLDAYFQGRLHTPALFKIDVEGAEQKVLAGMAEILSQADVEILLELHGPQLASLGTSSREVLQQLWRPGFRVYQVSGFRNDVLFDDWKEITPDTVLPNYFFVYATRKAPPSIAELRAITYSSHCQSAS